MKAPLRSALALPLLLAGLSACSSAYYATMEQFGVHKRDILVDRVEEGREDQAAAKEQFQTTLEAFQELTGFDGGDLEDVHSRLNKEYERSADRAEEVSEQIASIEKVASDLFEEWGTEITEMTNADLARQSRTMLDDTQRRYDTLLSKMKSAESRMEPVLTAFRDHVTFLKHNLNAKAIDSLRETTMGIEKDVAELVANMQASIDEADAFIADMNA